jgi:hypothetical protein
MREGSRIADGAEGALITLRGGIEGVGLGGVG